MHHVRPFYVWNEFDGIVYMARQPCLDEKLDSAYYGNDADRLSCISARGSDSTIKNGRDRSLKQQPRPGKGNARIKNLSPSTN